MIKITAKLRLTIYNLLIKYQIRGKYASYHIINIVSADKFC